MGGRRRTRRYCMQDAAALIDCGMLRMGLEGKVSFA